ncbi:MAG: hypothetical protein WCQ66_00160 [Sphaerochaetaceae bacterium]|jgi:hypothetical protein
MRRPAGEAKGSRRGGEKVFGWGKGHKDLPKNVGVSLSISCMNLNHPKGVFKD